MRRRSCAGCVVVAALASCGGREGGNADATGGPEATSATQGTAEGGSDSTSGSATAEESADSGPEQTPPPDVFLSSYVIATSSSRPLLESGALLAQLAEYDPPPFVYETETVGDCGITTITPTGDGAGLPSLADVGPITLSGGSLSAEIEFVTGAGYPPFAVESALWAGGETLTFSATGGAVPGFDADVIAPSQIEVTSPALTIGSDLVIDRADDLTITWTGESAGWLKVWFSDTSGGAGPTLDINCYFAPSAASGVVPSEVLGRIGTDSGALSIEVVTSTSVDLEGWGTVSVRADVPAFFAARPYTTIVDYQ